jgi:dUTP pyrophosphatase
MKKPHCKIINLSNHPLPQYETVGSAGMDLHAHLTSSVILKPMERVAISTGICIELPTGYEAQIRPRSGLAINHGITVLNSPGTVDADFRGEVKVILINLSQEDFEIKDGDRIAQMVIAKYERVEWLVVETLSATERGSNWKGSTGMD